MEKAKTTKKATGSAGQARATKPKPTSPASKQTSKASSASKLTNPVNKQTASTVSAPQKTVKVYMNYSYGIYSAHVRYRLDEDTVKTLPPDSFIIISSQ
jgi:hypothetical protein